MINCRGRNGQFALREARIENPDPKSGYVAISMQSKRPYLKLPPIRLEGPKAEIITFLEKLLSELKEMRGRRAVRVLPPSP